MSEIHRSYFSIIPATVRYDDSLSANAKLMYGELTALANEHGYAYATNGYFVELYKAGERSVIRWLRELEKGGHITSRFEVTKLGTRRKIFIGILSVEGVPKLATGGAKTGNHINITNNTIKVRKEEPPLKKPIPTFDDLISNYTNNQELHTCLIEYIKMRKANRKATTNRAIELVLKKLDSLTTSESVKIDIINQSIMNGWQGVFPLKTNNSNGKTYNNPKNDIIEHNYSRDQLNSVMTSIEDLDIK